MASKTVCVSIFTGHSVIESSTRVSQDEQSTTATAAAAAAASSSRDYSSESHWSGIRNLLFEASAVPARLNLDVSSLQQ